MRGIFEFVSLILRESIRQNLLFLRISKNLFDNRKLTFYIGSPFGVWIGYCYFIDLGLFDRIPIHCFNCINFFNYIEFHFIHWVTIPGFHFRWIYHFVDKSFFCLMVFYETKIELPKILKSVSNCENFSFLISISYRYFPANNDHIRFWNPTTAYL